MLIFSYDTIDETSDYSGIKGISPTLNHNFEGIESVLKYIVNNTVLSDTHPLKN